MNCWSCGSPPGDGRRCASCGALQPIDPRATSFDVLGLPTRMALDRVTLERAFRDVSRDVHPDRFRAGPAVERRLALEHTTAVNQAFQTLKDDRRRAEYLLRQQGIDIGSEEHRTSDPELLMEMMTLTESIDTVGSPTDLDRQRERLEHQKAEILRRATAFFDDAVGTRESVARDLERLRYLERLGERVEGRRAELQS